MTEVEVISDAVLVIVGCVALDTIRWLVREDRRRRERRYLRDLHREMYGDGKQQLAPAESEGEATDAR